MVANYVYGETVEANLLTGQTLTLGGGGGQTGKGFFIDIGDSNTTVFSSAINSTSIVLFTRRGAPVPGPGKGPGQGTLVVDPASIVDGVSFRVDLVDANGVIVAASNVVAEFDWFIINTS